MKMPYQKTGSIISVAVVLMFLSGCEKTTLKAPAASVPAPTIKLDPTVKTVSFSKKLTRILRRKCATCHLTGEEAGDMALHPKAAYKNLVGKQSIESDFLIVDAGHPEKSYLIMKLEGTHEKNGGMGSQMPFGATPLPPETIQLFKDWIKAGAPNN